MDKGDLENPADGSPEPSKLTSPRLPEPSKLAAPGSGHRLSVEGSQHRLGMGGSERRLSASSPPRRLSVGGESGSPQRSRSPHQSSGRRLSFLETTAQGVSVVTQPEQLFSSQAAPARESADPRSQLPQYRGRRPSAAFGGGVPAAFSGGPPMELTSARRGSMAQQMARRSSAAGQDGTSGTGLHSAIARRRSSVGPKPPRRISEDDDLDGPFPWASQKDALRGPAQRSSLDKGRGSLDKSPRGSARRPSDIAPDVERIMSGSDNFDPGYVFGGRASVDMGVVEHGEDGPIAGPSGRVADTDSDDTGPEQDKPKPGLMGKLLSKVSPPTPRPPRQCRRGVPFAHLSWLVHSPFPCLSVSVSASPHLSTLSRRTLVAGGRRAAAAVGVGG